jgi:hypothetical protein
MTAPRPWLANQEALPPELARALNGAPGEPSARDLTELASTVGRALGVALPVPVVAKALPSAASAAVVGGRAATGATVGVVAAKPLAVFGAWLVGGLALGAGLSGLAYSVVSPNGPAPREQPAATVVLRSAPQDARAPQPEAPALVPEVPLALPSAQRSLEMRGSESQTPVAREPAASETQHSPATPAAASESELSLLKRARDADPTQALALTAEHARRFPAGVLEQEREVIAIDALLRLGRGDAAAQRAKRFQTHFPGSAHARRLSALFESSTP